MRKLLIVFAILAAPLCAIADHGADIIARFEESRRAAERNCIGLDAGLASVRTMAGIGIGAGIVGTAAGGVGVGAGVMRAQRDRRIAEMSDIEGSLSRLEYLVAKPTDDMTNEEVIELVALRDYLAGDGRAAARNFKEAMASRNRLGNIRTGAAFASGAAGTVGALSAHSGVQMLDDLIIGMGRCESYVQEIIRQRNELRMVLPESPVFRDMETIALHCGGMDPENISSIRTSLRRAGIVSAIGAAVGIAGGVASIVAQNQAPGHGVNTAATVLSGAGGAAGLGGAILSGTVLSGLGRNADIAAACAWALRTHVAAI